MIFRVKMVLMILKVFLFGLALSQSFADSCSKDQWRCSDGSCISSGSKCDGVVDCDDGSDELHCRETRSAKACVYPEYPNDKTYFDSDIENARPGDIYPSIFINVTCQDGYGVNGSTEFDCVRGGRWIPSNKISECVRQCHLPPNPAVEYKCILTGSDFGFRACNEYELEGTEVIPTCRAPTYYAPLNLQYMRCQNGKWLNQPICIPDCGTVTPVGNQLIIDGKNAKRGEMPWHAGIYDKTWNPYRQICGGSIISTRIVLSAAHCFWDETGGKQQPSDKYAVAVGKLYRPWNDSHDESQHSDVKELHLSDHYKGEATHHQDDIAVVIVATSFEYKLHIRPICMDFDELFQSTQLKPENKGKIAGWGLTAGDGDAAPILQVLDMPYVSIDTCFADSPYEFRPFITSDKFCAGYKDGGKALCQGDSGGGLAFSGSHLRGNERYFLRGITSTASNNKNLRCNPDTYTAFTLVQKHEHFIKRFWAGEDDAWRSQYSSSDAGQPSLANCIMPYSNNVTTYKAVGMPHAVAGRGYVSMQLEVECADGYALDSFDALTKINCFNGTWIPSETLPECAAHCRLPKQVGTNYKCEKPKCQRSDNLDFFCYAEDYVPSGTIVNAECKEFYRLEHQYGVMVCDNGKWAKDFVASCSAVCGKKRSNKPAPWFAGIYSKESDPYEYKCGGTLIAESVVLSAASCFWSDGKQLSADQFAVALGKNHRSWNHEIDSSQESDVEGIYLPNHFGEDETSCRDDISIVILSRTIGYGGSISPACLYGYEFNKNELKDGTQLNVVTWKEDASRHDIDIPYSTADFDQGSFCRNDTTTLCSADAGAGWTFLNTERSFLAAEDSYYLHALTNERCNSSYPDSTWLGEDHRRFLKDVLNQNPQLKISFKASKLKVRVLKAKFKLLNKINLYLASTPENIEKCMFFINGCRVTFEYEYE